jgi:hypothetical protein
MNHYSASEPPAHLRYERKFLATGLDVANVIAVVRNHPALFREIYPARLVNSLYLDSPALRDFYDHLNGASSRSKTRIRWYGPLTANIGQPMLERKMRCGPVSGKSVWPLPPFRLPGGTMTAYFDSNLCGAQIPDRVQWMLRLLQPSAVIRYCRRYFQSADGRFRLTVDSDSQFFSVHSGSGAVSSLPFRFHPVIVELKFDLDHADRAAPIAGALPFRMTRCSKYVLGIRSFLTAGAGNFARRDTEVQKEFAGQSSLK